MLSKKTFAVVHESILVRKGLIVLLEKQAFHNTIEVSTAQELIDELQKFQPKIVFLGYELKGLSILETISLLKKVHPAVRIIVMLNGQKEKDNAFSLSEQGAHAFITSELKSEKIAEIVDAVLTNGLYTCDLTSKTMAQSIKHLNSRIRSNILPLSDREIQVLKLICDQYTNKEIAEILQISPRTVDTYRENILIKTGAKNAVGIAVYAWQNNLIEAPVQNLPATAFSRNSFSGYK